MQNLKNFKLQELEGFTDDFSVERRLGRGTYGEVFKGKLTDGDEIAVKVLFDDTKQVARDQFLNEFDNLKNLEHDNIIKLVGYTFETQYEHTTLIKDGKTIFAGNVKRALCIEYMPKGSLETYLSDECEGLSWCTRFKIIMGTCEAVRYLHDGIETPIHHLDIKPDNILLDNEMEPKLADFGLSKCFAEQEIVTEKNSLGTPGYIPPEHIDDGIVSKEFDIFSLGAVLVSIVTGHEGRSRSAGMPRQEFIDQVHDNWRRRLDLISMGSRLESYCQQVKTCTRIALDCLQPDRYKRPKIAYIVDELTKIDNVSPVWTGETELISVHPRVLRFPLETENWMTCPLSLINQTDSCVGFVINNLNYYSMRYWIVNLHPKSTGQVIVSMIGQDELPPVRMVKLEVIMITMENYHDLNSLETIIKSDPNNQSQLLTRIQELGGKVQGTTLPTVVFDPSTESIMKDTTKIIPPKQFGDARFLDVHPVEPWILLGHEKGYLSIWNYKTQTKGIAFEFLELRQGRRYSITAAVFVAAKQWIAVADSDGFIQLYTCPAMKFVDRVNLYGLSVSSLAVHPTKPCILVSFYGRDKVEIRNWETLDCTRFRFEYEVSYDGRNQAKFHPQDNDSFASTCFSGNIKLCKLGSETRTAKGPEYVRFFDYTFTGGDQENLTTMSPYGYASIWEHSTGDYYNQVHTFVTGLEKYNFVVAVMSCHPSLPILVTGTVDGIICLWNTTSYRLERRICCTLGEVFYVGFRGLRRLVIGCRGGIETLEFDLVT